MRTGYGAVSVILVVSALLASPLSADVTLNYLGAFKLPTTGGTNGVSGGDLAYYPNGNAGAGSLFVSRGVPNTGTGLKEIYEVPIPALVNTTDINSLNVATPLRGLAYDATNQVLYGYESAPSAAEGSMASGVRSSTMN